MNNSIAFSNIQKHILDKIDRLVGQSLLNYTYYDVYPEDQLTTNNNGIDIIAHQLKLDFTNNSIFVSWSTIDNWSQYSLCVAETSFCENAEIFKKTDKNWNNIIGQELISYEVYGYKENVIESVEINSNKTTKNKFLNEPHLLVMKFTNDILLGIANFYQSDNFIPTLPMGDDIWIIFGNQNLKTCIDSLHLNKIEK